MKVVVHFKGGLGNQLIQYAFAHQLACADDVLFDTTHYAFYRKRRFFLKDLETTKSNAWEKTQSLAGLYMRGALRRLTAKTSWLKATALLDSYVDDETDPGALSARANRLYLNGYFQHHPLQPTEALISKLNQLAKELNEERFVENAARIREADNPVMLHLRCGDYLSDPAVKKMMGICGPTYYQEGLRRLTQGLANYELFVFSDDTEKAKGFFQHLPAPQFVEGDPDNPLADFLLMRLFPMAVIPNSTLSYMASMLSVHQANRVVLPTPWFEDGKTFQLGGKKNWLYVPKK